MKEWDIISLFYKNPGILDDASDIPGTDQIVTTDSLAEGTHFRRDWSSPEDIAIKLFHANLSDIAASGADPLWCLLNLGLPSDTDAGFIERFARQLKHLSDEYGAPVIGGDTFLSSCSHFDLAMGGKIVRRLLRSGGRAGDSLYCTGNVGLSLAGFRSLSGTLDLPLDRQVKEEGYSSTSLFELAREKHLRPRARPEWGKKIRANPEVHAAMDISDGLVLDADRLARASGVRLRVDLEKIPVHPQLASFLTKQDAARSGEEFEILFLGEKGLSFDFPCAVIGQTEEGEAGVAFMEKGQEVFIRPGFEHF